MMLDYSCLLQTGWNAVGTAAVLQSEVAKINMHWLC